jgi:hypothetical protein
VDRTTCGLVPNEDEARLVPLIFRLYVERRLGSRQIASWINEHGHRTRSGDVWTYKTVLTILQNRSYLGNIYFRGAYHPATHARLVDDAMFEAAQQILVERGEDATRRRSNASDYLLSGRVVICAHCHSPTWAQPRTVGARGIATTSAAHGSAAAWQSAAQSASPPIRWSKASSTPWRRPSRNPRSSHEPSRLRASNWT